MPPRKTKVDDKQQRYIQSTNSNEAARIQSGFDPTNWNAAIHLQVKVRDAICYPVSMLEAFQVCERLIEATGENWLLRMGKKIESDAKSREQARLDEIERNKREIGPNGKQTG